MLPTQILVEFGNEPVYKIKAILNIKMFVQMYMYVYFAL